MLGAQLRAHRTKYRLTQKEMASKLGITREYYARLERGFALPSFALFETICSAMHLVAPHHLTLSNDDGLDYREMCTLCRQLNERDRVEIERLMKGMVG